VKPGYCAECGQRIVVDPDRQVRHPIDHAKRHECAPSDVRALRKLGAAGVVFLVGAAQRGLEVIDPEPARQR
jgi:hypothetical protein